MVRNVYSNYYVSVAPREDFQIERKFDSTIPYDDTAMLSISKWFLRV